MRNQTRFSVALAEGGVDGRGISCCFDFCLVLLFFGSSATADALAFAGLSDISERKKREGGGGEGEVAGEEMGGSEKVNARRGGVDLLREMLLYDALNDARYFYILMTEMHHSILPYCRREKKYTVTVRRSSVTWSQNEQI